MKKIKEIFKNRKKESEQKDIIKKDWKDIHSNFTKVSGYVITGTQQELTYQELWEVWGITYEEAQEWLAMNLKPQEVDFITWLKKENYQPGQVKGELIFFKLLRWQKEIHPSFTAELKNEWKKWFGWWGNEEQEENNAYRNAQEWIVAGLEPDDAKFAKWLENENYIPKEENRSEYLENLWKKEQKIFSSQQKELLKQKYLNSWALIHPDFTKKYTNKEETYQQEWEEEGFAYQDAQEWINAGFKPGDRSRIKEWKQANITLNQVKECLETGLDPNDHDLLKYLKTKDKPSMVKEENQAQLWLDKQYPLEGKSIDESVYHNYYNNNSSDEEDSLFGHFNFDTETNKGKTREEVNKLEIRWSLKGELKVEKFINLRELNCSGNKIIFLDVSDCKKLVAVHASRNYLSDLTVFSYLFNLEYLYISNNLFEGSLAPLQNLRKLKVLDISSTNIDLGLEYLPDSIESFHCGERGYRSKDRVELLKKLLEDEETIELENLVDLLSISSITGLSKALKKVGPLFAEKVKKFKLRFKEKKTLVRENELLSKVEIQGSINVDQGDAIIGNIIKNLNINLNYYNTNDNEIELLRRRNKQLKKILFKKLKKEEWEIVTQLSLTLKEELEKEYQDYQQQITIEEITEEFQKIKPTLKHLLGRGGYGEVYYGEWKLQEVAVKKLFLSPHNTPEFDLKDIRREINILKRLRNRYIIQYYDIYSDDQELLIIMDYAENGTLNKFINDNKDKEHNWSFNNELIRQIVIGLVYIHHENIIHRDLKSMNILLANNYQVKISDFGLSRIKIISSSQSKHGAVGTLRWMAPELLQGQKYSEQSDIYALGMTIWEIVAKCTTPFKDIDNNLVGFRIISGGKEIIPDDVPKDVCYIIEQCWKNNPDERIKLANILEKIENGRLNLRDSELQNSKEMSQIFPISADAYSYSGDLRFDFNRLGLENNSDHQNIRSNLTSELIYQWQSHNFTPQQCKEWLDVGMKESDSDFCAWLRDIKNYTPEKVLNHGNQEQLNQEFFNWWQDQQLVQTEQPPK